MCSASKVYANVVIDGPIGIEIEIVDARLKRRGIARIRHTTKT